jgi:tetraacyldisaccharide 4'-kinase
VDPRQPDARRDGDEPALLARTAGCPVVVAADRAQGAALAIARGADVVLLDDGFQHRRLARDLDLVLWAERPGSRPGVIPAGSFREPLAGLRRADAIVLVDRGDGVAEPPERFLPEHVFRASVHPVLRSRIEAGAAVHALSGVADPASFERGLARLGFTVTGSTRYPDHHPFTREEILAAAACAGQEGADHLAVTAKDRVRWPRELADRDPVPAVFDLDVSVESEELLLELVEERAREEKR